MKKVTHYVPVGFRMDSGEIGILQAYLIDKGVRAIDVANHFGISISSVYRMKNAVPADLVSFDSASVTKYRRKFRIKKNQKLKAMKA